MKKINVGFSKGKLYLFTIIIRITGTSVVLSPFIEAGKISLETVQVVDRDFIFVREASGENDSVSVTDSACVTWNKDLY